MVNLNTLQNIPPLYSSEHLSLDDHMFLTKFYFADYYGRILFEWYVCEAEQDSDDITYFGYVRNVSDEQCSEFGYFSNQELLSININGLTVHQDLSFVPCSYGELKQRIKRG